MIVVGEIFPDFYEYEAKNSPKVLARVQIIYSFAIR